MASKEQTKTESSSSHGRREDFEAQMTEPTHDEIAARAYQCWQERGGGEGSPEEDWNRAERELRAERNRTSQSARAAGSGK